jgi:hypothetical protein
MCQVNVDIINMGEEEANTDLLNKFIGRMPMPTLFIKVPSMPTIFLNVPSMPTFFYYSAAMPTLPLHTMQTFQTKESKSV